MCFVAAPGEFSERNGELGAVSVRLRLVTRTGDTFEFNEIGNTDPERAYLAWRKTLITVPAGDRRAFFAGWLAAKDESESVS